MKPRPHARHLAWALLLTSALALRPAHADIYTWVDSFGKVNVSNLKPPEGTQVTSVFREDPAARASAEAARAAAERDELRALTDRVAQLEQDAEVAAKRPPPAPIAYVQPVPTYPPVITQTFIEPASQSSYGDCNAWANCLPSGFFGFYPGNVIVVSAPHFRRFNALHPVHRPFVPPRAPTLPGPVGLLPPPPNLFPGQVSAFARMR
jgi:hypothetical protein